MNALTITGLRRVCTATLSAAACLLLTGCLLAPGEFTSRLELNRDGSFAFSYDGQIHMLGMDKLSEMEADPEFTPFCVDDETYEERDCTETEIAEQRAEWDEGAERRSRDKAEQGMLASAMMGGVDPEDPDAIEKFMANLRRQKGWKSVTHEGDGVFQVSFAISGQADRDFLFPTIEGMGLANHFVALNVRDDGSMRIDAPAFGGQGGSNPMQGMLAGIGKSGEADGKEMPNLPDLDGVFTIVTDGEILANNTDEGPQPTAGSRQELRWEVNSRTKSAPTALVRLGA